MKRCIFILLALSALMAQASDYTYKYLVFTSSDGTTTAVSTDGLTLTFQDGTLVASTGATLTLASLSKMEFSDSGETTIIALSAGVTPGGACEVFTVSGLRVGTYADSNTLQSELARGVYIVRQNGRSTKITVRK